jgi:transposase
MPVRPSVRTPHPGRQRPGRGLPARGLGQAATGAATFLGERYHRVARRRGKAKAQVAVARSMLVIIWHLLKDPAARFRAQADKAKL